MGNVAIKNGGTGHGLKPGDFVKMQWSNADGIGVYAFSVYPVSETDGNPFHAAAEIRNIRYKQEPHGTGSEIRIHYEVHNIGQTTIGWAVNIAFMSNS
jgi:hypothetical protein